MTMTDIKENVAEIIDDTVITAKVKTALFAQAEMEMAAISVKTRQGIVRLSGEVKYLGQSARAEGSTRGVSGVKKVINALHVS